MMAAQQKKRAKRLERNVAQYSVALHLNESLDELGSTTCLLDTLSAQNRDRVVSHAKRYFYERGEYIFRQGEENLGIYIIEKGLVRSFYSSAAGREITLAYWTPGHFVGGPQVFGEGMHMWSSVAVESAECLWLRGAKLKRMIREIPDLAVSLIEGLTHKGMCYSALLQLLGTRSMNKRLAHLLVTLSRWRGHPTSEGVIIITPFTHKQLADMVGATRQWVSSSLTRLERDEIIRIDGCRIILIDCRRLIDQCQ